MKKLLIMIALVAGVASISKAQGGGGGQMGTPAERAQRTIDGQQLAAYNFTADQKTKVLSILVKQNTSQDSVRTALMAGGGDPQAAMAGMMAKLGPISAANEAKIVALLTPDQKKTYDAALAAAKERNPAATTAIIRMGGRRPQQ